MQRSAKIQDQLKPSLFPLQGIATKVETHMNWHVEVIRLEVISHFTKALESIFPDSLFKSKGLTGFVAFLGDRT